MKTYSKPPLSLVEQLKLLVSRGLIVGNQDEAIQWLSRVSYYRLRGYTHPFLDTQRPDHPFYKPTPLEKIKRIYEFDQKLRSLVMNGIEHVEIAMRTQVIYQFSMDHGAWWFEIPGLFSNPYWLEKDLANLDRELDRSNELFLDHYRDNYGDPPRPPAWMSLEVVSFGLLSKLFQNLRIGLPAKKRVLSYFGLKAGGANYLENWMHHLTSVRNICAHHSRLWNRIAKQAPKYASALQAPWVPAFPDPQRMYATLSLLAWLTHKITGERIWQASLFDLIGSYPEIPLKAMGFPIEWKTFDLWKQDLSGVLYGKI